MRDLGAVRSFQVGNNWAGARGNRDPCTSLDTFVGDAKTYLVAGTSIVHLENIVASNEEAPVGRDNVRIRRPYDYRAVLDTQCALDC